MRLRDGLTAAASVALILTASAALAAEEAPRTGAILPNAGPPTGVTPRTADGHPNFTGLWRRRGDPSGNNVVGVVFGGGGQSANDTGGASNTGLVRDGNQNYVEIDAEFYIKSSQDMPQYKPEMWNKVRDFEEYGYRDATDPDYGCKNPGVVRMDIPMEIFQTPGKITLIYNGPIDDPTSGHLWVREVPTDGRPLPKPDDYEGLRPTGTSSGHWEGDTLVIETVDFPTDGVWYNIRGWVASDQAKVTERFRRQGNTLFYDQTVDDPNFIKPWVRPTQVATIDGRALLPQPLTCVEKDAALLPGTATAAAGAAK